jgi:subtilisin-like proprotein convertase family protein
VACGTVLDFEVTVTANEGGPWVWAFGHEVGQSLTPAGLPMSIPDNATAATSTLAVTDNVVLTDVNVRVQITHTWVGDLKIEIESPIGTRVTLLDRPGVPASTYGCSNDDMNVTFDSASSYNLETHCANTTPWYTGVAAPFASLNTLNGQGTAGTWKLIVTDLAGGDTGAVVDWELLATPAVTGVCNVCTAATASPIVSQSRFGLAAPRPNPFDASSELSFSLARAARTQLEIIDVTGRRVATLVDAELGAGPHSFSWNGRDTGGQAVAAGTYFVRLVSGGQVDLQRVVRLR